MRSIALAALLMLAATFAVASEVRFISPGDGAQLFGPQVIEITTDAARVDRVEFLVDGVLAGVAKRPPYRIAFDFGTSLEAREITARVFSNGYRDTQTATVRTAAITAGETINVDVVEVPLRIRSNRMVTADDLRVAENGVPQTIREIKPGRGPAEFVFIVDRSLSMGGGRLEAALRAIDEGAKMLRPGDSASIVLFNHNVSRPRPLGIRDAGRPSGGTALRDALASANPARRTYTIAITDGGDRNSVLSEEEALRRISGTRSIVSAIVLGSPDRFLQRATANTGGTLHAATKETIDDELRRILADINSRYTLVYQSHGTRNGWRSIALEPRRRGIEIVSARKGYFAR